MKKSRRGKRRVEDEEDEKKKFEVNFKPFKTMLKAIFCKTGNHLRAFVINNAVVTKKNK